MKRTCVTICGLLWIAAEVAHAQAPRVQPELGPNSSITAPETLPPPTMAFGSPLRTPPLPPRQIDMYDIVSIRIDELARMQAEGEVERRKNTSINAQILDWIKLNGFRGAKPDAQSDGDQRVQAQLDELLRAENEIETTERLTFNIASRVVDIRPNGNIVLEAHKVIRNNDEVWEASLSGICRQQDIGPDNVILSRNIVDLRIDKRELGHINDSVRRGWLMRIYDKIRPF